jgi:probable F420-dependent oxidoreductase
MHAFRFGVIAESPTGQHGWLDLARRVEGLGYSTLLIRDHLGVAGFGDQLAPIPAVMAAAMATSRLRVGTMVIDNDFRHPALLAKELATIDSLSGGRLEIGIGAGWLAEEYRQAGLPFDAAGVRITRLAESLTIMKRLWTGEPVHYKGEHYQIDGLTGFPIPAQQPHPPVLIGGTGPRMLALAGREATSVSILTTSITAGNTGNDPAERQSPAVAAKIAIAREAAGARASSLELSLMVDLVVTDHRRRDTDALAAKMGWSGLAAEHVRDMPAILIGSTGEIADLIVEWRERLGVSYIVIGDADVDRFAPVVSRLAGR